MHPHGSRALTARGFTMVELLIAIALSSVVILLAYASFNFATESIKRMNRITTENRMLRTGIMYGIDGSDFWRFEADPGFPHMRGYMSWQNTAPAAITGTSTPVYDSDRLDDPELESGVRSDNPANRRLFRRVQYQPAGDEWFNMNNLQPHRLESIHRNHLHAPHRTQPWNDDPSHWWSNQDSSGNQARQRGPVFMHRGSAWHEEIRSDPHDNLGQYMPRGWSHRHVMGDYSLTSSLFYDLQDTNWGLNQAAITTTNFNRTMSMVEMRGARPRLLTRQFRELGLIGAYHYVHAGALSHVLAPSYNLQGFDEPHEFLAYSSPIANDNRWMSNNSRSDHTQDAGRDFFVDPRFGFCVGELPWITADPCFGHLGNPGPENGPYQITYNLQDPTSLGFPGEPFPALTAWHVSTGLRTGLTGRSAGDNDQWSSNGAGMVCWEFDSMWESMFYYPTLRQAYYSRDTQTTDLMIRGSAFAPLVQDQGWREEGTYRVGILFNDHAKEVYLYPYRPADVSVISRDSMSDEHPEVSVANYRMQTQRIPTNMIRVLVVDPGTGLRNELWFNCPGTDFRGARQHWGMETYDHTIGMSTMGDCYYVP